MKELSNKVFKTIFILLSLFIVIGITIYNASSYVEEYEDVKRSLEFREVKNNNPLEPRVFDNMLIMDYEVYTVVLNNNQIVSIISHSNNQSDFDIKSIAESVINKNKGLHVGNLYSNKYSYNYESNTITIINTSSINKRLTLTLIESMGLLFIIEIVVLYISRSLTKWITKPAEESFNKQKTFIADASHELKTPLAVIMASSDELKSDKKNEKYVDNIKYEAERMSTLIKGLLDLSKLESGTNVENYKEENLSNTIERVSSSFEGIAYDEAVQNICGRGRIVLKFDESIETCVLFSFKKDGELKNDYISSKKYNNNYYYIDFYINEQGDYDLSANAKLGSCGGTHYSIVKFKITCDSAPNEKYSFPIFYEEYKDQIELISPIYRKLENGHIYNFKVFDPVHEIYILRLIVNSSIEDNLMDKEGNYFIKNDVMLNNCVEVLIGYQGSTSDSFHALLVYVVE